MKLKINDIVYLKPIHLGNLTSGYISNDTEMGPITVIPGERGVVVKKNGKTDELEIEWDSVWNWDRHKDDEVELLNWRTELPPIECLKMDIIENMKREKNETA